MSTILSCFVRRVFILPPKEVEIPSMTTPRWVFGFPLTILFAIWKTQTVLFAVARTLYLNGPGLLGCWEGQSNADICARLTTTTSDVWRRNLNECNDLIDKKVTAYVIGSCFITAVVFAYHLIGAMWNFCWWKFVIQDTGHYVYPVQMQPVRSPRIQPMDNQQPISAID